MTTAAGFNFGAPVRPFQQSFWGTPLPANATLDTTNGPAVVAELAQQSKLSAAPTLNVWSWTAEPLIVPASQPLVPVAANHDAAFNAIMKLGVPIPPGTRPTNDSDSTLTIWQPDYVNPKNPAILGRYYELYAAKPNVDANGLEHWSCGYGGRLYRINNLPDASGGGRFYSWQGSGVNPGGYATDPDSTYTSQTWGVQGSGVPYMPGVITAADCARGYCDHTLMLEVAYSSPATPVWPAFRTDGNTSTSKIRYGMRLRFPPGYQVPQGLHPICATAIQGARDHGLIVTDQTSSSLAFRAAPSAGIYVGVPSWQVLNGFPWQDLQLLAVGSDSNPTPTT